jgi:hypothetical protein
MTPAVHNLDTREKLLELAAKCEAATGPDAAIDREIWLKAVADKEQRFLVEVGRDAHGDKEANFRTDWMADGARYTASLDAAMTLVPEGVSFALGKGIVTELGDSATDYAWCGSKADPHSGPYCWAATPALALCAAALRARNEQVTK